MCVMLREKYLVFDSCFSGGKRSYERLHRLEEIDQKFIPSIACDSGR
jgi:hypothetical protein